MKNENRTVRWGKRFANALLPCSLLVLMYTLFAPLETVASSSTYLEYTWLDLIVPLAVISVTLVLVLSLIVSLFNKKVYRNLILVIVGIAVGSYCQTMFLNPDFGLLDGTTIQWHTYTGQAFLNLLIWAAIIAVPFVLKKLLKPDVLKTGIALVCVMILAAQAAGVASLLITSEPTEDKYLSAKDNYTVSAQNNIIMFCLDNLSNELFEDVLEAYPDIREGMKDFVYYNNANCNWRTTFPAMLTWSTGVEYNPTESVSTYFRKAWQDEDVVKFYNMLHQMGYKVNIYAPQYVMTDNIGYMEGLVDNIDQREASVVNYDEMLSLYKLTAFRSFPIAMKATVWVSTDEIQRIVSVGDQTNTIQVNYKYITNLRKNGLEADDGSNRYIVQYLTGAHSPFRSDENGNYDSAGTDELRQTAGYLRAFIEYLDELKRLGVYDNATVILTADHGAWDRLQFAYCIKEKNASNSDMQVSNAPISPQVEHLGTVMTALGQPGFSNSIYDHAENEVITRTCNYMKLNNDYALVQKYDTGAEGGYNVVYQIDYEGDRTDLEAVFRNPSEIIPMVDSFF